MVSTLRPDHPERAAHRRVPDLAVFQASTIVEQDGYIHSAPQLAVEVLSPANTRREREEKLNDYASHRHSGSVGYLAGG